MPAWVHYVDLTAARRAKSTFGTNAVRFVDLTNEIAVKSTLCTLTAANLPTLPTQRS